MLIVVCVEGCHGSGKSELCRQFAADGFTVLDEGFLTMPSFDLHPQTLVMESIWISNWFERLLRIRQEDQYSGGPGDKILIADRSPFSAVYYAGKHGHLLDPMIRQQISDLRVQADIHIFTVLVKVEKDLLWSRIQARLVQEPHRSKYNEGSREWMEVTNDWYTAQKFDFVVDNSAGSIDQLKKRLVAELCSRVHKFQDLSPEKLRTVSRIPVDSVEEVKC